MSTPGIDRRTFLGALGALGIAACSSGGGDSDDRSGPQSTGSPSTASSTTTSLPPAPDLERDPFTLGVASGDPLPDRVMLWTRLAVAPDTPEPMPNVAVPVAWEVARDADFADAVTNGVAVTDATLGHAVRVDATGLEPGQRYYYRFKVGPWTSPPGRTRTAPAADDDVTQLRLAVTSCNAYTGGYYTTYARLATDDDVDVVVFLGDYIYELSAGNARQHGLAPPSTLDEYRRLYAVHHADPDLQAAHGAHPWIMTWDDHEVEDNYAALEPGGIGSALDADAREKFAARRAAAYRAWWENTPVRVDPPDDDGGMRIYRAFTFGDLAHLTVVDSRQYRSSIPVGDGSGNLPRPFGGGPQLDAAFDPDATFFGPEQEAWLLDQLDSSTARWNVLAQQTIIAECDRAPDDPAKGYSMDAWDGYVAARNRLLGHVADASIENFVALSGDIHTSAVTDLVADYMRDDAPVIGAELVAPSASSIELLPPDLVEGARRNRHIKLYDIEQRGYLHCDISRDRLVAQFRYVSSTASREYEPVDGTTWEVLAGQPGATEAPA